MKSIRYLAFLSGLAILLGGCSSSEEIKIVDKTPASVIDEPNQTTDGDVVLSPVKRVIPKKEKAFKIIRGYLMMTDKAGNEKPVPQKSLVLQSENYEKISETKTSANGFFQFTLDIPEGGYSLIYDDGTYHRVFDLEGSEKDFGYLNINPRFD